MSQHQRPTVTDQGTRGAPPTARLNTARPGALVYLHRRSVYNSHTQEQYTAPGGQGSCSPTPYAMPLTAAPTTPLGSPPSNSLSSAYASEATKHTRTTQLRSSAASSVLRPLYRDRLRRCQQQPLRPRVSQPPQSLKLAPHLALSAQGHAVHSLVRQLRRNATACHSDYQPTTAPSRQCEYVHDTQQARTISAVRPRQESFGTVLANTPQDAQLFAYEAPSSRRTRHVKTQRSLPCSLMPPRSLALPPCPQSGAFASPPSTGHVKTPQQVQRAR